MQAILARSLQDISEGSSRDVIFYWLLTIHNDLELGIASRLKISIFGHTIIAALIWFVHSHQTQTPSSVPRPKSRPVYFVLVYKTNSKYKLRIQIPSTNLIFRCQSNNLESCLQKYMPNFFQKVSSTLFQEKLRFVLLKKSHTHWKLYETVFVLISCHRAMQKDIGEQSYAQFFPYPVLDTNPRCWIVRLKNSVFHFFSELILTKSF